MITIFGLPFRAPSQLTRLVLLLALSSALMLLDHRSQQLDRIRAALAVVIVPIQYLAGIPARVGTGVADFFTGERALKEENAALKAERELLQARLQQFTALEAENARLREMLGSAARIATRAIAADLLEVAAEPFTRKIIIARGAKDGLYVGQPVIDAHGVMGQVTQVASQVSRVTLITDPGHALPVLVNRNGLRALVYGTGAQDTLKVPYLTSRADIQEGDLLVTSGMGGSFPPGYPVARVAKIVNDPNEAFLEITVTPEARLNHSKQALLIWPDKPAAKPAAAPADARKPAAP